MKIGDWSCKSRKVKREVRGNQKGNPLEWMRSGIKGEGKEKVRLVTIVGSQYILQGNAQILKDWEKWMKEDPHEISKEDSTDWEKGIK